MMIEGSPESDRSTLRLSNAPLELATTCHCQTAIRNPRLIWQAKEHLVSIALGAEGAILSAAKRQRP